MREQDFLPLQSQEYCGEMCEDRGNVWKLGREQQEDTGQRWFWYYIGEIDIAMIKSPQKC